MEIIRSFFAVDDEDEAVFVYGDEVAGFQPTVDDGFICGVRHIEVALHDRTAFDDEFAHFARGTSTNSSSTAFTVRPGRATPTLAVFWRSGVLTATTGEHSLASRSLPAIGTREFGLKSSMVCPPEAHRR